MAEKEIPQWKRRRNHPMIDQHGRPWECTIDFIANGPCSPINPKFSTPLDYPQKYLRFQPEDSGRLKILYDEWINDLEVGWKDWDTRLYDDSIMLFGQAGLKMYEDRAPALMRHTGPAPLPVDLVKGAKAGNKYMLGLTDKMPEWVKALMPSQQVAEPEFPDAEDEIDKYGDVEEIADPNATGGKRENPRKNNTKEAA